MPFDKEKATQACCDFLNNLGRPPHPETKAGDKMPPAQKEWCLKSSEVHQLAEKTGLEYDRDENWHWSPRKK